MGENLKNDEPLAVGEDGFPSLTDNIPVGASVLNLPSGWWMLPYPPTSAKHVWHYTSIEGLLGIVEKRELWA